MNISLKKHLNLNWIVDKIKFKNDMVDYSVSELHTSNLTAIWSEHPLNH